jgi:hypothetical protein
MRQELETHLEGFVAGDISLARLEDALLGTATLRFSDTNEREVQFHRSLPNVRFGPEDIVRTLERYLAGTINGREASDWAAALRLLDCFDVRDDTADPDSIWDAVDQLMAPDVWGNLSTERAIELIHQLGRASHP